jgi:hypothetical protein
VGAVLHADVQRVAHDVPKSRLGAVSGCRLPRKDHALTHLNTIASIHPSRVHERHPKLARELVVDELVVAMCVEGPPVDACMVRPAVAHLVQKVAVRIRERAHDGFARAHVREQ